MRLFRGGNHTPDPKTTPEPTPREGWLDASHTFHRVHVFPAWLNVHEIAVCADITLDQAYRDILSEPHRKGEFLHQTDVVRMYFDHDYDEYARLGEARRCEPAAQEISAPDAPRVSGWDRYKRNPNQRAKWDAVRGCVVRV